MVCTGLGSPLHLLVLATSAGRHSDYYLLVHEDMLISVPGYRWQRQSEGPGGHGVLRDTGRRRDVLGRIHQLDGQPVPQRVPQQRVSDYKKRAFEISRSGALRAPYTGHDPTLTDLHQVAKGWPVEKVREQVADPCCRRRPDRHDGRKDERAEQRGTQVPDTLRGRSWRSRWRFAAASCTSSSASSQPLADHPARPRLAYAEAMAAICGQVAGCNTLAKRGTQ